MIKIEEKKDEKEPVKFKDLEVGQSFLWEGEEHIGLYRKLEDGDYLHEEYNTINLNGGKGKGNDAFVIPIYSKLIWSRKEEV